MLFNLRIHTSCLYLDPSFSSWPFLVHLKSGFGLALKGILITMFSPFSKAVVDSNLLGREILGGPVKECKRGVFIR